MLVPDLIVVSLCKYRDGFTVLHIQAPIAIAGGMPTCCDMSCLVPVWVLGVAFESVSFLENSHKTNSFHYPLSITLAAFEQLALGTKAALRSRGSFDVAQQCETVFCSNLLCVYRYSWLLLSFWEMDYTTWSRWSF